VEVSSNGEVYIYVSSTVDGTRCHRCGRDIHHRHKEVDTLRKKEMGRLKRELEEEEYKKPKGSMWLVRKDPDTLDEKEWATLRLLCPH